MYIIFLQQIISSRLLRVVIGRQKHNFIGKFKIGFNNNLLPMICYKSVIRNVVDVTLFFHNTFIFSCGWFHYDVLLFYFGL